MAKRNKKTLKKISKELKKDKLLVKEIFTIIIVLIVLGISIFYVYNNQKHTVSFNSNGGTAITSRKIIHNKKITNCDIPVRDGYEFIGWYYNENLFECNQRVSEDIVLEAKWKKIEEKSITSIIFSYSDIVVKPNTNIKLVPIIEPIGVTDNLFWSSNNTEIAEVDINGNVNLKKEGIAEITVSTDNNIKATQQITVSNQAKSIEKISLSESNLVLDEGSVKALTYVIEPYDATNKNVKWMSDNTSVVTVSQTGEIVAKEPGEALIILTTMDDSVTVKCHVKVVEK